MIKQLTAFWSWLFDGLTDAAMIVAATFAKARSVELLVDGDRGILREPSGKKLGHVFRLDEMLVTEPPDLRATLQGIRLDVIVPERLVLHRNLNPLATESMPFLDTFVRHQIERVTPWRAADAYFAVSTSQMEGKPPKVAITLHAVARRLVNHAIVTAHEFEPGRLRLLLPTLGAEKAIVPINDDANAQRATVRKFLQIAVVSVIALLIARLAFYPTQIASVQSQTADLESEIEDQEATLSALRGGTGHFGAVDLIAIRQLHPRAVEILENLSVALPDDDYLTSMQLSNNGLHISGISNNPSDLVPSLEGSRHFREVSFAEPITRVESGAGNRFHLSMLVVTAAKGVKR
jgi:general secretion pathway protein L